MQTLLNYCTKRLRFLLHNSNQMNQNPNRSLIGVKPMPSTDDRKTTASPPSISSPSTNRKVIIKSADMKEEMQTEAVNIAISAFEELSVEKDVAEQIKKEFDKNHGPTWHCIVGKNFGSYVTHETNHFVYFYLDSKAVLLFKSG